MSRVCARFVPPCGGRRDNYTTQALGAILRANKASLKRKDEKMTENNIYNEPYCVKDGCLYERKSGTEIIRLADFVPLLKAEVTYYDGIEQKKQFRIGGVHSTGEELPEVTVSADDMSNMRWLLAKWGVLGAAQPGKNTLSKIGHAILCTRENVTKETVYLQTGWHKIGGEYFFLLPYVIWSVLF